MRKLMWILIGVFHFGAYSHAQIIRLGELEEYAKERYGDTWKEAAMNLKKEVQLDSNGALAYSNIIDSPGKSASELYVLLNYWFVNTFNDANSVVQLNDKELGVIIATGYLPKIARHDGGISDYSVAINPVIRIDIKNERVKVDYTVPYYAITEYLGQYGSRDSKWAIDNCYPFKQKDKQKNTSSKALVMAHAYSKVIMDRIESVVRNGAVGDESQDW